MTSGVYLGTCADGTSIDAMTEIRPEDLGLLLSQCHTMCSTLEGLAPKALPQQRQRKTRS